MVAKYVTEFTVQSTKGAQRRLRAEQHAQRLARKALRDAARKASQSEDAARSPTNIIGLDCATEPTKVGYPEWANTYETSVPSLLDMGILERIQSIRWSETRPCLDRACGTGRTGSWLAAKVWRKSMG